MSNEQNHDAVPECGATAPLTLSLEGGLALVVSGRICPSCGHTHRLPNAEISSDAQDAPNRVIPLIGQCPACATDYEHRLRIRRDENWSALDIDVGGEWRPQILGNILVAGGKA